MTLTAAELGLYVAVIGLGGIVVGGLIAGGFALLTGWLDSGREHRRWLREQRFTSYRAAVSLVNQVRRLAETDKPKDLKDLKDLKEAKSRLKELTELSVSIEDIYNDVFILGPRKVSVSLMRLSGEASKLATAGGDEGNRSEFLRLRAQFVRDIQDQLRAGFRWQRVTQADAAVFKEIQEERAKNR